MYQPYPSREAAPPAARPAPPPPIVMAARVMYVGAAVSALNLIAAIATIGSVRAALHKASPNLTATDLHAAITLTVIFDVISALIYIGLWIGMAYANRAGHSWARIASTVLFALNTLLLAVSYLRVASVANRIVTLVVWLIGLTAVVLLWRKESSDFFSAARGS